MIPITRVTTAQINWRIPRIIDPVSSFVPKINAVKRPRIAITNRTKPIFLLTRPPEPMPPAKGMRV